MPSAASPAERIVAREGECDRLAHFLDLALAGKGQICFIAGQAGAGKTALTSEFERLAQNGHADLLIISAACDPQVGVATPYAPFREALAELTGVDKPRINAVKKENNARVLKTVKVIADALVKFGPDLVEVFVPGGQIIAKFGEFIMDQAGWRDKLKKRIEEKKDDKKSGAAITGITQDQIVEQYVNFIQELTRHAPLVIILDDLHWADAASIDLLVRLSRRASAMKLLLVCTYRPDEVQTDAAGKTHVLEKTLTEMRRQFGDVWLDIDHPSTQKKREFINALLDGEPNLLGPEFRDQLLKHTDAHPLFTVELLRVFQEDGTLQKDADGKWRLTKTVSWDTLPARVEGVIETRLNALSKESRECLNLASVEGQIFTAEAIAKVQNSPPHMLVRLLGGDLSKTHQLVKNQEALRVGSQRLSMYGFAHGLIQGYLYNALDAAERAYLHESFGFALEGLYGDRADLIAPQLARHFEEADVRDKALSYLIKAGEQAARAFANDAALDYFNRALALTEDDETRFRILIVRERVLDLRADRANQAADLAELTALTAHLPAQDPRRIEIELRTAEMALDTGEYDKSISIGQNIIAALPNFGDGAPAVAPPLINTFLAVGYALLQKGEPAEARKNLEQALQLARKHNIVTKVSHARELLGNLEWSAGAYALAQAHFEAALADARAASDTRREWAVLNDMGILANDQRQFNQAKAHYTAARAIAQTIGDRVAEMRITSNLGQSALESGEFIEARAHLTQALALAFDSGDRRSQVIANINLAETYLMTGEYDRTEDISAKALAMAREINFKRGEVTLNRYLSEVALTRGEFEASLVFGRASFNIAQAISSRGRMAAAQLPVGRALLALGRADEAEQAFDQARILWRELGNAGSELWAQIALAEADLAQGKGHLAFEKTQNCVSEIMQNPGGAMAASLPMRAFVICAHILQSAADARAERFIELSYDELLRRADKISQPPERASFLLNVPENAAVSQLYRDMMLKAN